MTTLLDRESVVEEWLEELLPKAQEILGSQIYETKSLPKISIRVDLRGRTAGQAVYRRSTNEYSIRINIEALEKYPEHVKSDILPHELAHILTMLCYVTKVPSHGFEWRRIARQLGCDGDRCHSLDLKPARVTKKYDVYCGCSTYKVTKQKYRNIVTRTIGSYRCRKCKDPVGSTEQTK